MKEFESPCIGCDYHNAILRGKGRMECAAFETCTDALVCGMRCPPFSRVENKKRIAAEEQKKSVGEAELRTPMQEKAHSEYTTKNE